MRSYLFQGERVGGMERVLIIGALTFVGYHLVNKMIAEEVKYMVLILMNSIV